MSEKPIETLFELLDKYTIEIPIVQRDYAQGRKDSHTNMVRSNLLKDMRLAIQEKTEPLDLNFVYGKVMGNNFIPLDGQQRLTTLFFLHLFAFYNDEGKTELFGKFTYETRKSSRDFLKELTLKRNDIFTSDLPPSVEIQDSEWFVSAWKYDPTVQSSFIMLDAIKECFVDVKGLAEKLSSSENPPITFKFLDMKELGMEDSLYIKLNARGKPLSSFENFKAQLIGRQHVLDLQFSTDFDKNFDGKWTDLFWTNSKENFDKTYLMFFGVLFMNKDIISRDAGWENTFEYEKITTEIFETIYYTLNYLSDNKENKCQAYQFIFKALLDNRTYSDRILFHAVTTYLYKSKGIVKDSFKQWLRIIKNLTENSRIDEYGLYKRAVEEINRISNYWNDLLLYFSTDDSVSGFSQDQIVEERIKARIILQNKDFAVEIYKAEEHPYFNGQIRSALFYANSYESDGDLEIFKLYWSKISKLFNNNRPIHGNLLRRALLTFGDYTLQVGAYKTLCVDNPDETAKTPSMKRLFSNHGTIIKELLDSLNLKEDIEVQLERIILNSNLSKTDWRYCLVAYPNLFKQMSSSHLRLRDVYGEMLLIPNKSSNGYNFEIFITALKLVLTKNGVYSTFDNQLGTFADRYLNVGEWCVRFDKDHFIIYKMGDLTGDTTHFSTTDDPISEITDYIIKRK